MLTTTSPRGGILRLPLLTNSSLALGPATSTEYSPAQSLARISRSGIVNRSISLPSRLMMTSTPGSCDWMTNFPFAAYQTSGEQASLELLAREGLADLDRVQLETWTAMRRAGADMIISYAARRARTLLGR